MKKILLAAVFALCAVSSGYSKEKEIRLTITTSCGVEVEMIYQPEHTGADVYNDTLILEAHFCSDESKKPKNDQQL